MLKKYLAFNCVFALVFIAQLFATYDSENSQLLSDNFRLITKPLIVISLMIFYVYQSQLKNKYAKRIFAGLLFGLVGDILLMFTHSNENFFLLGLAAFLIGHLLYLSAFYIDYKINPALEKSATRLALVIFGVYCLVFYFFLRPHLVGMKIPVMIYAFVISLMAIMAVNRKGRVNHLSFCLILVGAVLFLISDSFLAYHKFVNAFSYGGMVIMATYMLAQYFITIGAVERNVKEIIED